MCVCRIGRRACGEGRVVEADRGVKERGENSSRKAASKVGGYGAQGDGTGRKGGKG